MTGARRDGLPSGMSRAGFVARFGGVFEHSPWIAEAAFDAGLGAEEDRAEDRAENRAENLHAAMTAILRRAPRPRKLALIRAHPDLAGRLAIGRGLTAASSAEQAGAGLDHCTAEEYARFAALHDAYTAKFGFPFIMAVKGRRRDEIRAAFERRLANDAETEFETALAEIERIALFRLRDLFG